MKALLIVFVLLTQLIVAQKYELEDVYATWKYGSGIWAPNLQFTVRNKTQRDMDIYFKVIFLNQKGVIVNEQKEIVTGIPVGTGKSVYSLCEKGYESIEVVYSLFKDKEVWTYKLYQSNTYSGKYKEIKTGGFMLSGDYERERKLREMLGL